MEYTSDAIQEKFGALGAEEIDHLRRFPCIFAYEAFNKVDPHFGLIRDVTVRGGDVRVDYEIHPLQSFLTAAQLDEMAFELEIGKWELNRTHRAVKDVDLPAELSRKGIALPRWAANAGPRVNLSDHHFDVALSFPGEARHYVEEVAQHLERLLGPDRYFYDRNYTAQLARPSLDTFLQGIYRDRSRLIVVFAGGDYQRKNWCGIEFRAVREIINRRDHDRIMFVRMDEGEVEGILGHDGYADARQHKPAEIAAFICERVVVLR
ncbi:TIR domain-containing protein [Roseospira navarrensis]|nr:TIR domain-containing protein [Roseospira navarrensis]